MNRSKLIRTYTDFIFVEDVPVRADILLIPGSILLPRLLTHLSGQKCAVPQKNDNCI